MRLQTVQRGDHEFALFAVVDSFSAVGVAAIAAVAHLDKHEAAGVAAAAIAVNELQPLPSRETADLGLRGLTLFGGEDAARAH